MGKTTVLRKIYGAAGGTLLSVRQLMGSLMEQHPSAIEEAFLKMMEGSLLAEAGTREKKARLPALLAEAEDQAAGGREPLLRGAA